MSLTEVNNIFFIVGNWISNVWTTVFGFYSSIGFLNVIIAMLFILAVFRFILLPLIGTFKFDQDVASRASDRAQRTWRGYSNRDIQQANDKLNRPGSGGRK